MNKNVCIVLGRGIEGCGVTTNARECSDELNCEIFHIEDKKFGRASKNIINSTSLYLNNDNDIIIAIEILEKYENVIFFSIPSLSHSAIVCDNFLKMVQQLKTNKALMNVDHKIQSIKRNANIIEICTAMDILMTHSFYNDFSKFIKKMGVKTPLKKMGVGYNYDRARSKYWKDISLQNNKTIRWLGRTAAWKGPLLLIDFHHKKLKEAGYLTILEGLEANINYRSLLYDKAGNDLPVENFFRNFKDTKIKTLKNNEHGVYEDINKNAFLYPPYIHIDCMERLSLSAFGSDLYFLPAQFYGNNIEYCHAEPIAVGTVPIFHKHFCDNVYHTVTGDIISSCKNSGTIGLDDSNYNETFELIEKLANDDVMRDEWREMAFEFWKSHSDITTIANEILLLASTDHESKIIDSLEKNELFDM